MRTGRPKSYTVKISDDEREQLQSFARSRSLPHARIPWTRCHALRIPSCVFFRSSPSP